MPLTNRRLRPYTVRWVRSNIVDPGVAYRSVVITTRDPNTLRSRDLSVFLPTKVSAGTKDGYPLRLERKQDSEHRHRIQIRPEPDRANRDDHKLGRRTFIIKRSDLIFLQITREGCFVSLRLVLRTCVPSFVFLDRRFGMELRIQSEIQ